jgi:predicted AlkP superfamily phosphohydrolase/phosphomutase
MRTLIIGFDSFDPGIYETLSAQGLLPNLKNLASQGGYSPLKVSTPPQTEVSWTSIATGADPGEHGIFDFVHRNPANYAPFVSILVTQQSAFGTQFVRPYKAHTLFDEAIDQGYPATVLWWPAMFPSKPDSAVQVLPGLGTPDIRGQLGVGMFFSSEAETLPGIPKTPIFQLDGQYPAYRGHLNGPFTKQKNGVMPAQAEFSLEILKNETVQLKFERQITEMTVGQWSPVLEVRFKTGFLFNVQAITRAIVTSLNPVRLYFLPIQIHPLNSVWRYGTPPSFVKETWKTSGPFLSLGWPQDTTGLEDGCISDEQFLALCDDIFSTREQILINQLKKFNEGILASIFDDLDRVQHMFRRTHPEVVNEWYIKLDQFVGRVLALINKMSGQAVHLLVLSDHGFADFNYKVHINRWLLEHNYLVLQENTTENSLAAVDWSRSIAYAVGLNSLYLNLAGREGQGILQLAELEATTQKLQTELQAWLGPDGKPVFSKVYLRHEAFSGPLIKYGPDLVLGYASGYRASSETGLGKWANQTITENTGHWEADHCIDSQLVPGVIFSNQSLEDFPKPSFRDIPALTVGKYLDHSNTNTPPVVSSGEDQKTMEERMKGLGYL